MVVALRQCMSPRYLSSHPHSLDHPSPFVLHRYPEVKAADLGTETDTNQNQQLCYHVVGQPQSQDVVVLADPQHPLWMFGAEVTDDGR